MNKRTNVLLIMDGYGLADRSQSNAVKGFSPFIDSLAEKYPYTTLQASGLAVGLPQGQMGNSEVGHLNIGAGRVVYQELNRISNAITEGDFFTNTQLTAACQHAKKHCSKLHLMGLVSDGGVHSHITHIYALLQLAAKQGVDKVYVHCFLDGRDTPPQSGAMYVKQLQQSIAETGVGKIATVVGRYYAMDRDKRWDRLEKAYDMLTLGVGLQNNDAVSAIQLSYSQGITDEFIAPVVVDSQGLVEDNDSVIFFNFRPDRAREITSAFTQQGFDGFDRKGKLIKNLSWVCMTQYHEAFTGLGVAFLPQSFTNTLGQYLAQLGLKQLRIAETEKYAHVTFFFNGGVEKANDGEHRVLIDSPQVATYDLKPEMSAYEVSNKLVELLPNGYDVIVLNLANCDMVGHTGVLQAAQSATKTVDSCVQRVVNAVRQLGGRVLITADHGNAEQMQDSDGNAFTAHTTNCVPFILVDDSLPPHLTLRKDGKLCDIVPTLLQLMQLPQPTEMTGKSLIQK